ncbi:ABC transporter ATP-binding protein [Spiroplasma chinense]|uniref:ABC transporter ATP-binding protein n=1 Tax=Spiroplasma chinense TaxID=216932 RepID=A0A5B9Y490_9MOLU|nr:ABC transporter ATP-binding protein/permease [Spiroplasma chinense]QEH61486.1 ABC transporter ATP-binding protein [Spiroplasma chinense]
MGTTQSEQVKKSLEKDCLVKLTDVTKDYGKKNVLKNINLEIKKGDRIGIIGPNGGGKSTLSEIIAGIRKPTSGSIEKKDDLVLGIQFQESKYPIGITVIDMIKYYLDTFSIEMKESELLELMRIYQILGFQNKFVQSLSGGQQQRLNILLGLIHNPDLVIFDEVSTGLDIEVRSQILDFIKEKIVKTDKSLILVTHSMSEIEELCNKYIYIHRGEIRDSGSVESIVKEHGSVHDYTWKKFNEEKKADLEAEYLAEKQHQKEKNEKKNKFDRIISSGKIKNKNIPLINLLLKYYIKGFAVPFFMFVFPILMLFLIGNIFTSSANTGGNEEVAKNMIHSLVGSYASMAALGVGFFVIPATIIEFKASVLMKRIGATNIKPIFFLLSVVVMGFVFVVISALWAILWAGIIYGHKYGWDVTSKPYDVAASIFLFIPVLLLSMTLGLTLASMFKSTTTYNAIVNVIYMPITFLSGGFSPIETVETSAPLKAISWINPFKYSINPFVEAWNGKYTFNLENGIYLGVSCALIVIFLIIPMFKLRWQD